VAGVTGLEPATSCVTEAAFSMRSSTETRLVTCCTTPTRSAARVQRQCFR